MACCAGHPIGATGPRRISEATWQLRGEAGERQLKEPKNALVTGIGYVNFLRNWNTSIAAVLEV